MDAGMEESPVYWLPLTHSNTLQSPSNEQAGVEELEQLLAKSAQWGQYLLQRNDDLEAENACLRGNRSTPASVEAVELETHLSRALLQVEELTDKIKQLETENARLQSAVETIREAAKEEISMLAPSIGGSADVADWLVEYALEKVEDRHWRSKLEAEQGRAQQLQARAEEAEAQLAVVQEESCSLQQEVVSLQEQARRGSALAQDTQQALDAERGETAALRAMVTTLHEQLDDHMMSMGSAASVRKSTGSTSPFAAEFSVDSGKSLAEEMDMFHGDGQAVTADVAVSEEIPGSGLEFVAECDWLRKKVEQALSSSGKSLVNCAHEPTASEPLPVAIQALRSAVNAMLSEFRTLHEQAKFNSTALAREASLESTPRSCDDSVQANPERQAIMAPGQGVGHDFVLQRECKQLRKEVGSAVEWVRRARRLTEAKHGMLNVHGALATRTGSSSIINGAPLVSAAEVKQLQLAVVRAAEAEREAHDLLAAKQELLAAHEATLRESDKIRLDEIVSSVECSLNSASIHTNGVAPDGQPPCSDAAVRTTARTAVWHVLDDTSDTSP